jgi:dTMP kinase
MKKEESKKRPFIVLEALDAGGSQTQTDLLCARLKKEGYIPRQYHFPQEDRATGRIVYDKFLLNKNKFPFTKREQALLYIQDFFSKQEELSEIVSSGNKNEVLVSDRFATSTMAYQTIGLTGLARKKMIIWIDWLCYKGKPTLPKPDAVLFLDTPVKVSLERLAKKKKDFFETKEKLTAIRNSYLKLAKEQKWIVFNSVDAKGRQRTRQELHVEIWGKVSKYLPK